MQAHPLLDSLQSIEELDSLALFSFSVFSDNKGDSPISKTEFAKMASWMKDPVCIIGLGDHVKRGWQNDFLTYYENREFNFYPNIADGENEFYGKGQDDYCAGLPLLDIFGIPQKSNVQQGEIPCDYYAQIPCPNDFTIHLIQLHFSDSPEFDSLSFKDESKEFLHQCLVSIPKTEKDIVIAAAHSRTGEWHELLPDSTLNLLNQKAHLVFSATSHFFKRLEAPENAPLFLNTGSITHPSAYCPPGYLDIHVVSNPFALVVQYINAAYIERELQNPDYACIKYLDGKQDQLHLRERRELEDFNRIIGEIPNILPIDSLFAKIEEMLLAKTSADKVYPTTEAGLPAQIKYKDLWDVFPYNNEIAILTLAPEEYELIFEEEAGTSSIKLAISLYLANYLADAYSIESPKRTGIFEQDLLLQIIDSEQYQ